jgi:CRP-like cAMP-binding protein
MGPPFLDVLDEAARAGLRSRAAARSWPVGATLFHQGEEADHVLVLTSGLVKAVATSEDGQTATLGLRGPGEILGELAAVDGGTRSASVVAIDAVEALSIPIDAFREFLRDQPGAALALLSGVADRLRDASRRQAEFGTLDATARVARMLSELGDTYGEPAAGGLRIDLVSQDELASLCGASREAVARALRTLRSDGMVRTGRRTITISDVDRLRRWPDP